MLNSRIRYRRYKKSLLLSKGIVCDNSILHVAIHLEEKKYVIVEENDNLIEESSYESLQQAKRKIRKKLLSYGARLYEEIRKK